MSSLAASRADNFYFPPEWTPAMGGLSKYQGSKGANQFQQYGVVRFELPFDGWCLKCDRHICKGHRFNAKKEKIGKYFTTILYSFATKCPSVTCDQKFLIKTDPEHRTYDFAEGLRKMVQDFTPGADDGIIEVTAEETKILIDTDPMYKLQHDKVGKLKADAAKTHLEILIDVQNDQFKNDFDSNSRLRQLNRNKKRRSEQLLSEGHAIGLSIPLVESSAEDELRAKQVVFDRKKFNSFQMSERVKVSELIGQSIFKDTSRALDRPALRSLEKKNRKDRDRQLGGDSKRYRRDRDAMRKQAVINLNVENFKLTSSVFENSAPCTQIIPKKKIIHECKDNVELNDSGKIECRIGALAQLYADYASSDSDPDLN